MDSKFESNLGNVSDEMLKYVGITNLDFDMNLSKDDLEEVKKMLFSINTLMQVTFKEEVSIKNIEDIKYMLELSPMCDDKRIEKMILRSNTPDEVKALLSMPYLNPDTWHISYQNKDGSYMITTLPNYRIMEEYIDIVLSCVKSDMSLIEKIKEVYDFVKLLELDEEGSTRLPDIIISRKTNNLGFSLLFCEILKRLGINGFIGEVCRDDKREYITLIDVEDKKYDILGIYCFDPASDSIPKEMYKSDAFRKINYNFFGLTLKEIINTKFDDKLLGVLSLLNSESLDFANRRLEKKDRKRIEDIFGYSFEQLYERVRKTKLVDESKLIDLFVSTIHEEDFLGLNRNVSELLSNNYSLRKKELFNPINDDIKTISIHDV